MRHMMPTVPRVHLKGLVECHHLGVQSPKGACEVFRLHGPEQEHPALMEHPGGRLWSPQRRPVALCYSINGRSYNRGHGDTSTVRAT